eukprot:UN11086
MVYPPLVKYLKRQKTDILIVIFFFCMFFPLGLVFIFYFQKLPMGIIRTWFPIRLCHFVHGIITGIFILRHHEYNNPTIHLVYPSIWFSFYDIIHTMCCIGAST